MKKLTNKSGFTLLEIIIVIIIIGVLASLALPRLFGNIEYSRSTEALDVMTEMKRSTDRCAIMGGVVNYAPCLTWAALGVDNPNNLPNTHFGYGAGPTQVPPNASIVATRNAVDGGVTTDTITFTWNTGTGVLTRAGTTAFTAIR